MADFLLGLDFGTGGAKGCIIDTQGKVLSYSFREYPIISRNPGWSEHDPAKYWNIACDIIRDCIRIANIEPETIKGIAVSSALPCMVMVDKSGTPIHNAYNLMDRRATEEVQFVKDKIGEQRVFAITANRLDDHPSLVNLLWERKHRPDSYGKIHKILTIEGYIVYKLTGTYTLVHQNAVFFGVAYDIRKKCFDDEILNLLDIDKKLLPELRFCDEIVGELHTSPAEEVGLIAGIPVAAGQADFNAACIASGVTEEGDIQCNLGTCGNFGIIHRNTNFLFEMIAMGFTASPKDTYITIPTTTTGGMSIRYIRDTISHLELSVERSFAIDSYDLLNQQAFKAPAGSEGLVVLPFLMGERTPIWDVHARGCIFGLSLNHTKGHIVRATMEGVAYAMYDSFRLIKKTGMKINAPIVMHEGGAKSSLWRKIITDVFNAPTVLTKKRTGAPFGDAVLAGVATGIFKNYSMCKEWAEYIDPMEPDAKNHELYMEYFELFKSIYNNVKADYRRLAELRSKGIVQHAP